MTIEIPECLRHLPTDNRGYPVPVIVQRDHAGAPMFAANHTEKQRECVKKKLCPICGKRLTKELWFCGGPKSAFHPNGGYYDSAMHHDCMTFALKVCPYLAMPLYHSNLEAKLPHMQKRTEAELYNPTMEPGRPKVFVAVMSYGQHVTKSDFQVFIAPLRPYHGIEFWQHGKKLSFREGLQIALNVVRRMPGISREDIIDTLRLVPQE